MKVAKRFTATLFAFWMSLFMALIMSGVLVAIHSELDSSFMERWTGDFILALVVAFPATLLVTPIARRLTSALVDQ